jgi:hypothetical protein
MLFMQPPPASAAPLVHRLFVHAGLAPGHWLAMVHSTQRLVIMSQMGSAPPVWVAHIMLLVHPGRHVKFVQMGVAIGQLAFDRHWTHWPVAVSQVLFTALPMQFMFVAHCTHWNVVMSQMGPFGFIAQFMFVWHCTQAPVAISQMGARNGHITPPSPVQGARHR